MCDFLWSETVGSHRAYTSLTLTLASTISLYWGKSFRWALLLTYWLSSAWPHSQDSYLG